MKERFELCLTEFYCDFITFDLHMIFQLSPEDMFSLLCYDRPSFNLHKICSREWKLQMQKKLNLSQTLNLAIFEFIYI